MKTAKMIFAALAMAALMTSCVKEAEVSESLETGIKMEFTASWAEGEASRTVVAEDGAHIIWCVDEQINVFYGAQFDGVFTSTNTEPAAIVTFQGMLNILTGSLDAESIQQLYWAIYPYNENNTCDGKSVTLSLSCNQFGSSGTFADKFFPAVACGSTPDLAFYNVCGGARFSVVKEGVQKVVFRSNDGSPMSGTVIVGFGEDNKPQILEISDAKDYIVVNAPEGGFVPGENYFATMLPQYHEQGITVTLCTASQKAIKTIANPVTFNRSTYKKLDNADEGLEYTDLCEIVDLGLSVKWASCNIGASAPEEYGDWFAWGEVEPKENYSWETYKWCMGSESTLTKYCTSADYGYDGFTDDKTVLDPEDDAATVNWGDDWRMPTADEFSELVDECTWEWTTLNGVYGAKFTSNKEGYTNNWIFLPAALSADTSEGLFGDYWTSSLVTYSPYFAYYLFFNQFSDNYLNSYYRYGGRSVRPVYQKLVHVTGVSVSPESATVSIGEPLQLTAAITPDNATDMSLNWSSSDESVAKVSADGAVEAIGKGTAEITVTTVDGGYTASCTVSVIFEPSIPEAVDLGLSVKWASFNLGASSPEHNGAYFAWGEVEPKADYSWETYKWSMGSQTTITKYCTNSTFGYNGFTDNKTVLEPVDDAATVNLGSGWRMPTFSEIRELVNNCSTTWTTINGVNGWKFTSNKDGYTENWIFLPAAGCRDETTLYFAGYSGYYGSSSLYTYTPYYAYFLYFDPDYVYLTYLITRESGLPVRPVYGEFVHVTGVSISPENATTTVGESSLKLTATISPANAPEQGVTWSSSDESVATVSYAGVVTGIAAGTAIITVTTVDGGYTASCTVTVEKDETVYVFKEDFEDSSTLGGWWSFDADGDGYNWDYINSTQYKTHSGTGIMSSASYYSGQALTPDNWLFTPAINFTTDNYLSLWTCGQDPNYPLDFYAVYITDQEPSADMLSSCEELYHETLPDGVMHQHIIQIPAGYANKTGYIAFRHYNCTDWFRVNLDDVVITEGAPATASSVSATSAQAPRQRLLSVPFQKDRANGEILNSRRGDVQERRAYR